MKPMGIRRTYSRRTDGIELVRATVFCAEELVTLAAPWIENALSWMDECLVPYAKRVFDNDPASDKRFSFRRFEYSVAFSLALTAEETAELCVKTTLSRARGAVIEETERRERLRPSDLSFLPPEKRKKAPRRVLKTAINQANR